MTIQADFGMIGLAVMGENLVLNMANHGFTVAVWNRTPERTETFLAGRAAGLSILGFRELKDFCAALKRPRKVMLLVKAGNAIDTMIAQLLPFLEPGDIIIDGGNSHYPKTAVRERELADAGIHFVGSGVSGGEEGALKGPSLMPGGDSEAWPAIQPVFESIAAKAHDGSPCCAWIGPGGSGHFVKMVHNGIEYGDMQLICEAYSVLKNIAGLTNAEIRDVFALWNTGKLDSYLIEITRDILAQKDPETGADLIDVILDAAGQKGTGKWTSEAALDAGVPVPTLTEAVFARCLSAMKQERMAASVRFPIPEIPFSGNKIDFIRDAENALFASKVCSYAQGFQLLRSTSASSHWNLDLGSIAAIWRGGCIIRARFLDNITAAFRSASELDNLLMDPYFSQEIMTAVPSWRRIVSAAVQAGVPVPGFASALTYFDSYRTAELPANLLQAQRDFFGAHTYERVDKPRGKFFHTDWQGLGGSATSTPYNL